MFHGNASSLFAFARSGHSLYRRTLMILTARVENFALGVSLGIRFAWKLARNWGPVLDTGIGLGCSVGNGNNATVTASAAPSWMNLVKKIHRDERGSVSLEQILLMGGISLPILIFTLKTGWPKIRGYFTSGLEELEMAMRDVNG